MKIQGINLPDNCTLLFHANGVKVGVSLNIPKELLKFMPKNNVWKGKEMYIYFLEKEIPLKHATPKNMKETYEFLLNRAMRNIRERKVEMLKLQVSQLKDCQQKLNF